MYKNKIDSTSFKKLLLIYNENVIFFDKDKKPFILKIKRYEREYFFIINEDEDNKIKIIDDGKTVIKQLLELFEKNNIFFEEDIKKYLENHEFMKSKYEKLDLDKLKRDIDDLKNSNVFDVCDDIDRIIDYIEECEECI